ncbi:MAG TPA: protease pro-enzyme activation domain-containing protein [Acetobacteraceae bacterium]|nr:protease pro-enzyme activation domain-containing protein [Acetobacteraceae bacterium]
MSYKYLLAACVGACALAGAAVAAPGVRIVGAPEATSQVSFEVALPLRHVDELQALLTALHDPANPQYHHWLTPAEFGLRFGPDATVVTRVTSALEARGLAVVAHTQSLHVTGSVAAVEAALGTHLELAATRFNARGTRVVADGAMRLPAELVGAGATVMSFGRAEAHPNSERAFELGQGTNNRYGNDGAYWYDDLKQAYEYPSYQTMVKVGGKKQRLDGTGVTIGALMSSDVLASDIQAVFDHENWSTTTGTSDPTLYETVEVNGGGGLGGGAFDEASLDTQMEIGGAPGAHVILYSIPDLSDGSVFAGYVTAIEANEVDILSSSFGGCELFDFPKYNGGQDYRGILRAEDDLFLQGNAQGISFLASSGDSAGKECPSPAYFSGGPAHFKAGIESPADDPNVTAVGGTNLQTVYIPGSLTSDYAGENAWSDPEIPYDPYGVGVNVNGGVWGAGGGFSKMWPAPAYQSLVTTGSTMRAVPDIGMQVGGCPGGISKINPHVGFCNGGNNPNDGSGNEDRSAVVVAIAVGQGGGFYGFIGTSVSSPELASALALLVETQGRMGNVNTYLYRVAAKQARQGAVAKYLHTEIPGYNGLIQSNVSATYSVSAGIGTPVVKMLIGQGSAKSAGVPQTISNP